MLKSFFKTYQAERVLLGLLLLGIALGLTSTRALERWDRSLYDVLITRSSSKALPDIVILAIDQQSLAKFGRWPWPRRIHAAIIDKLSQANAKVIGYDVIFAEADSDSSEDDALLTAAIARSGRVILPVIHESSRQGLPLQLTMPLQPFADAAAGLGHINVEIDSDALVRSSSLKVGLGTPHWPAFSLAMLRFTGSSFADNNLPGLRNTSTFSPFDQLLHDHRVLIPFVGPPGQFTRISCADFLEPDFDTSVVKNTFVLIGATALGMGDALSTPVSGESVPMPGVEINANILQMLRTDTALIPLSMKDSLVLTGLFLLLSMFFYPQAQPRGTLITAIFLLVLTVILSMILLRSRHLWFGPASILFTLALSYPLWAWRRLEHLARELFRQKERAQVTLNSIGDGVVALDSDQRVQYMNPVAVTLTGYSLEQARGRKVEEIFSVTATDGRCDLAIIVAQCLKEKRIIRQGEDGLLLNPQGDEYAVRMFAGPIRDESGSASGVVLGISDISDTKHALVQLEHQASHDSLTGLPNRSLLIDRLKRAIIRAQRSGNTVAVLFLDLDNFKKVNDRIGHPGGDQLLQEVTARLQECVRKEDTVARLGGDEFIILLENLEHLKFVTGVVQNILDVFKPSFLIKEQSVFISSSIGVSFYPKNGGTPENLLQYADTAMYRAKESGKDRFCFFSRDMNDWIQQRLELEHELRQALQRNEMELYYQPQINLDNGLISGVEALLRWKHPEKGLVSPNDFIPVAEECGLIVPIGEWVLRTACRQAKEWETAGVSPMRMAVNLSPRQFLHSDIFNVISSTLVKHSFSSIRLELEITEGLIMKDPDQATKVLNSFRELGGLVAIDDFGTGYSSLSYLKNFPVDQIKIDRSFIRDIAKSSEDAAITQAIITMAHGLKLEVVAEGVEREEQLAVMQAQQCDRVQGYYFSKALPAEEVTKLLFEKPFAR